MTWAGMLHVRVQNDFESWRHCARRLLLRGVEPREVSWGEEASLLISAVELTDALPPPPHTDPPTAPRAFLDLARKVACPRDASKWDRLYRVLFRLTLGEEPHLLDVVVDD